MDKLQHQFASVDSLYVE